MNKPYPLLLRPVIKDYIWGGRRLIDEYKFEASGDIAAEGWMLACHKDGTNVVTNGPLAGQPLDSVLSAWGYDPAAFPLLIKLIDAADRLSVQVHPDDSYAYENEGEAGKTEMWYVVDCKEGASLVYGLKREISRLEFACRVANNTLPEILNTVPVRPGDVFFIEAGTIHAIGAGILIAEIQQNSNTTYRVSDYGRLGADGKPRPLHLTKAMEVADLCAPTRPYGDVGEELSADYGSRRHLADCTYFSADAITLRGSLTLTPEDFISVLVTEGSATLSWQDGSLPLKKGDSIFLPKGTSATVEGEASLICSAPKPIL